MKNLVSAVILLLMPLTVVAQQNESIEQRADSLYNIHEDKQALELYKQVLEEDSANARTLRRTSLLYSRIGNRFEDEDDQRVYFNKGIDLAKQALQADSTDAQPNFVMAVAMGRKALISGARDRVAASRDIKKYAERAIRYDSTHAGAWHLLGRWNFKVANLGFVERIAANTLFGGIPGNASNEKAKKYIEKAIGLDDRYVLYYYDLAKVYKELGNNQKATRICQKAFEVPNLTPDDEQIKQDCRELIEDLQEN